MLASPSRPMAARPARDLAGKAALAAVCAAAMAASLAAGDGWSGLWAAGLVPVLAAIAVMDARRFIIPDELNAAGLALGLVHAAATAPSAVEGLAAAGLRGAALALLFLAIRRAYRALRRREGLGLGDVKLAALAGTWLEVAAIPVAIEIAALAALFAYGLRQMRSGRALRADGRLPFGLFFAPAIWIGWILDRTVIQAF